MNDLTTLNYNGVCKAVGLFNISSACVRVCIFKVVVIKDIYIFPGKWHRTSEDEDKIFQTESQMLGQGQLSNII